MKEIENYKDYRKPRILTTEESTGMQSQRRAREVTLNLNLFRLVLFAKSRHWICKIERNKRIDVVCNRPRCMNTEKVAVWGMVDGPRATTQPAFADLRIYGGASLANTGTGGKHSINMEAHCALLSPLHQRRQMCNCTSFTRKHLQILLRLMQRNLLNKRLMKKKCLEGE